MWRRFAIVWGVMLLGACANFDPRSLQPGVSTEADVCRVLGAPKETWTNDDGTLTWSYPTGPYGMQCWMLRLDAAGKLVAADQVMQERYFGRVQWGKSTREEVRRMFGPPMQVIDFARRHEQVWDYRYREPAGYAARFYVVFDAHGIARSTGQARETRIYPGFAE